MSQLTIYTTTNDALSDKQNADFITISGLADKSLNVYENHGATAELWGNIVGDPVLGLTDITLDAGQDGNGFIGNGKLITPEPSSLALLGTAALGAFGVLRRRIKRHVSKRLAFQPDCKRSLEPGIQTCPARLKPAASAHASCHEGEVS